jgi:hypothetical protein
VLGGPIRSATLDKKTADNPTCYYESSTSAAGLAAYCAETGQILAGLRNGATDLDGSAPEAGNVNGKGRRVFTITEDGSCVLDLAVIRAADTSADVTKVLAAGLLEAYNSAKVHKP